METGNCGLLVVGASHAGSELAVAARQGGWPGRIVLLGEEQELPYQRPPLSKAYLLGQADAESLMLRPATAYAAARIEWRGGVRLMSLDRSARQVTLSTGEVLGYDKLALCTGGRARRLVCDGLDPLQAPTNLLSLRTREDSDALRRALQPGARVVIVGGGYVGLEVAASARSLGAAVTVLEAQPRVLARVAGPEVSAFYEDLHRAEGVQLRTGATVARLECHAGRVTAVVCADGARLEADVVLVGVGMVPNVEAARAAGLADEGGIPVDALSRTVDPHIVAAGDCTLQDSVRYGLGVRLESVPNALEQSRAAASWLVGNSRPNQSVPWFWSDQYGLKLQMTGLSRGYDTCVLRGQPSARSFCAFYLRGGRLLAVDAVDRPAEFMLARRALAQPPLLEPALLADESTPLRELLAPPVAAPPGTASGKP